MCKFRFPCFFHGLSPALKSLLSDFPESSQTFRSGCFLVNMVFSTCRCLKQLLRLEDTTVCDFTVDVVILLPDSVCNVGFFCSSSSPTTWLPTCRLCWIQSASLPTNSWLSCWLCPAGAVYPPTTGYPTGPGYPAGAYPQPSYGNGAPAGYAVSILHSSLLCPK